MATEIIKTVKPSGGDYSSLSAWEAGESTTGDLVTLDQIRVAECYSFEDTAAVTIDGWTTDATHYIKIYTPAAERHDGKWNTAKYRLSVWIDGACIYNNENDLLVLGIQVSATHGSGRCIDHNVASAGILVDTCVLKGTGTGGGACLGGSYANSIRNSVLYGRSTGVQSWYISTVNIENCTIVSCGTGINRNNGTVTVKNTYAGNCTTEYSGTMTRTTCAHSSATVYSGSTASIAYDTSNFTNVTSGSENLHLVSGSGLIGGGTDLSGSFTLDIDGQTRIGTWDIGADEFIALLVISDLASLDHIYRGRPFVEGAAKSSIGLQTMDYVWRGRPFIGNPSSTGGGGGGGGGNPWYYYAQF